MKDWKTRLFEEVRGKDEPVPEDFEEWLNKCISVRYGKGTPVVTKRQMDVMKEYYENDKTMQQIADEMGVSRQSIGCTKDNLIKNLKRGDKLYKSAINGNDSVFSLNLSNRALCRMYENDILTVQELDEKLKDGTLARTSNVGKQTIRQLMELVAEWKIEHGVR